MRGANRNSNSRGRRPSNYVNSYATRRPQPPAATPASAGEQQSLLNIPLSIKERVRKVMRSKGYNRGEADYTFMAISAPVVEDGKLVDPGYTVLLRETSSVRNPYIAVEVSGVSDDRNADDAANGVFAPVVIIRDADQTLDSDIPIGQYVVRPIDILPYTGERRMERAREILNDPLVGCMVYDAEGHHLIVGLKPNATPDEVMASNKYFRVCLDVVAGQVAWWGYPPVTNITTSRPITSNGRNWQVYPHTVGAEVVAPVLFNAANTVAVEFEDGRLVIAWLWTHPDTKETKMMLSTNKYISASRAYYNKLNMEEMYVKAGGPTREQLFNAEAQYSNFAYMFIVKAADLFITTKQKLANADVCSLVNLGVIDLGDPARSKYPREFLDVEPKDRMLVQHFNDAQLEGQDSRITSVREPMIAGPGIYRPGKLSIEEANYFLEHGYYLPLVDAEGRPVMRDPRGTPGQALMVYVFDPVTGALSAMTKISCIAIDHRATMQGRDYQNRLAAMCHWGAIAGLNVNSWDDVQRLQSTFILYQIPDLTNIDEAVAQEQAGYFTEIMESAAGADLLFLPLDPRLGDVTKRQELVDLYRDPDARVMLAFLNYLVSTPQPIQPNLTGLLNTYVQFREAAVKWLYELHLMKPDVFQNRTLKFSTRVYTLLRMARDVSVPGVKPEDIQSNETVRNQWVLNNIRNLIRKEAGTSLYAIFKEMFKYYNPTAPPMPATTGLVGDSTVLNVDVEVSAAEMMQ